MEASRSPRTSQRQQLRRLGEPVIPPEARIATLKDLQTHLQTAIEVEHATIPPYLCALYSIKDNTNLEAARIIKSVVLEEMLHMILAANVLNAIGGHPNLRHSDFVPKYPSFLPHSHEDFRVSLEKLSRDAIKTFRRIERPAAPCAPPQSNRYDTLAQFYTAIEIALCQLDKSSFIGKLSSQVTPEHYYGSGGEVLPVIDTDSALQALREITGQGEGVDHSIWDGDEKLGELQELAHYFRFDEIYHERRYSASDTSKSGPSGTEFTVQWDQVYPMRRNPKTSDYPKDSALWRKAHEFNRAYTTMLGELDSALNGKPKLLIESVVGMYDLKYQAVELMKIPVNDEEMTAGPSFEHVRTAQDGH
jgi:hypothetical protein